jgi:circadian clock protein KaiC
MTVICLYLLSALRYDVEFHKSIFHPGEDLCPKRILQKSPTGIKGLDEITGGGLPAGRPTLVCGGTGCGKTLLAMEFLVRGATEYDEPGVFISFEEKSDELIKNFASLGFDLNDLLVKKAGTSTYVTY